MAEEATGAIVLAGGKSERMGQDKALLLWNDRTLLEHVIATVSPLVDQVVVVADAPNKYTLPGVDIITDIYPGAGPVGGIVTGLMALASGVGHGRYLAVGCDMPALRPALLRLLLESTTSRWDAVVPVIGGRPEPLCAVYRSTALPILRRFLSTGKRAAHEALKMLRTRHLEEPRLRRIDPDLISFTNINTPQDLEAFMRRREQRV